AIAVDLSPAGDAGPDLVAQHVVLDHLAIELVVGDRMRSRPDDAHPPLQDVDELRQLVDRSAPQEAADAREARIVLLRLDDGAAVLGHRHGAELVDDDIPAVEAVAALPENHR